MVRPCWSHAPVTRPRYQELAAAAILTAATADGRARVTIIAGAALGVFESGRLGEIARTARVG